MRAAGQKNLRSQAKKRLAAGLRVNSASRLVLFKAAHSAYCSAYQLDTSSPKSGRQRVARLLHIHSVEPETTAKIISTSERFARRLLPVLILCRSRRESFYTMTQQRQPDHNDSATDSEAKYEPAESSQGGSANDPQMIDERSEDLSNSTALSLRLVEESDSDPSGAGNIPKEGKIGLVFARKTVRLARKSPLAAKKEIVASREFQSHKHLLEVHATYETTGSFRLVLRPVVDRDLEDYLLSIRAESHFLTADMQSTLKQAFGCLASALAFMHMKKIRHKDIKPRNILIHDGSVFLTDFGTARDMNNLAITTSRLPDTERYCAPEVSKHQVQNRSSDIFSLGCVFLEICAALVHPVKVGTSDPRPYHARVDDTRDDITSLLRQETSSETAAILMICLNMIHEEGKNRRPIDKIHAELCTHPENEKYFCPSCISFMSTTEAELEIFSEARLVKRIAMDSQREAGDVVNTSTPHSEDPEFTAEIHGSRNSMRSADRTDAMEVTEMLRDPERREVDHSYTTDEAERLDIGIFRDRFDAGNDTSSSVFGTNEYQRNFDPLYLELQSNTTRLTFSNRDGAASSAIEFDRQDNNHGTSDTATDYSADSDASEADADYLRAFVQQILRDLQRESTQTKLPDVSTSFMNETLRQFSWRLYEESRNPFQWEVSVAFHRRRK